MKRKRSLYHGSETIIKTPIYGKGRAHNDFGLGFYCTENKELAKEWACTSENSGFSNEYSLDPTGMNILKLNSPEYSILNWMAILIKHRLFRLRNPIANRAKNYLIENFYVDVDAYDIVIGYRADDSYFDFADAFLNNAITLEQLSRAMYLGKLGEQIVLKSKYAFQQLEFQTAEPAEQKQYYPLRKKRNDEAEQTYRAMAAEETDGLYMIDILREKVRNDDPRIFRNIP